MMRPPGVCPVSSCGSLATPTTTHHAGEEDKDEDDAADLCKGSLVITLPCNYINLTIIMIKHYRRRRHHHHHHQYHDDPHQL